MKYGTSLRVRHLVGRLEKGEEFVDALRRLCARERVRSGTFQAIGVFSSAELQEFVAGQYTTRFNAETHLDIISLSGNVSTLGNEVIVNTSAMLGYAAYGQRHLVGGHVAQARVYVCEFALTAYDDLILERTYDAATGLPLWNRIGGIELAQLSEPETRTATPNDTSSSTSGPSPIAAESGPIAPPAPSDLEAVGVHVASTKREPTVIRRRSPRAKEDTADPSESDSVVGKAAAPGPKPASMDEWQDAVRKAQTTTAKSRLQIPEGSKSAASGEPADDEDLDEEEVTLKPGDVLKHPTLGLCRVVRVEEDEWAFIRGGNTGKLRKLALHLFEVQWESEDEEGRDVYLLKKRRER